MRVDAVFLPDHLEVMRGRIALVIDALRATSTAIALFEAGAAEVPLAADVDQARRLKAEHAALLVGEEVGRTAPAPGCDLGPSPVGLADCNLRGRRVVLFSTNGTVGVRRAHDAVGSAVYVASLANLSAAAKGRSPTPRASSGTSRSSLPDGDGAGGSLSTTSIARACSWSA